MHQNVEMNRDEQRLALVYGLDDPVRRSLYDYVSGSAEPVGRDEAATAVGIGRPLAAYHLDRLVSLGLLTADYRRPPGRNGPGAGQAGKGLREVAKGVRGHRAAAGIRACRQAPGGGGRIGCERVLTRLPQACRAAARRRDGPRRGRRAAHSQHIEPATASRCRRAARDPWPLWPGGHARGADRARLRTIRGRWTAALPCATARSISSLSAIARSSAR